MTQEEMNLLVPERLNEIERTRSVKILHACESGSRAWGFFSPDSDFDVRFIYKRSLNEYLSLNEIRDVIEMPIDDTWDVSGWDLSKTLRLLFKSNPTLYEWLSSPVCYLRTGFADRIKPLLEEYFSSERMIYHYLNIAGNNMKQYMNADTVRPKKYFYMLRPILACLWVLEEKTAPPVLFSELEDSVMPRELKGCVDELMNIKINTPEKSEIERVPEIDRFLNETSEMIRERMNQLPKEEMKSWDDLNQFFISELRRGND